MNADAIQDPPITQRRGKLTYRDAGLDLDLYEQSLRPWPRS